MIKSMTGFGKGQWEQNGFKLMIEMKSVNHRYQEMNIRLPKLFFQYEEVVRKEIKKVVHRGKIEVFVSYENNSIENHVLQIDKTFADQYIQQLRDLQSRYDLLDDISVGLVARRPETFKTVEDYDNQMVVYGLEAAAKEALTQLLQMRVKEGNQLRNDLMNKLQSLQHHVKTIEEKVPELVLEYEQKLRTRLTEFVQDHNLDEVRLAVEIGYIVNRSAVDEELVRLVSHIEQFQQTLSMEEPVGRKLDFILQEMNREVNTIGSKINDISVSSIVVQVKTELEKIREQVQNIE